MSLAIITLEAARAAKAEAKRRFGRDGVVGVGLTRRGGRYAVKVNLERAPRAPLPDELNGVPVVVEIVGTLRKR